MDPIALLKADHRRVEGLFAAFDELGDSRGAAAERGRLAEELFRELEVHSRIEEEVFYPRVREHATRRAHAGGQALVAESFEEHHAVDVLIGELRGLDPADEGFAAKFKVLRENVEHHIQEEEEQLMPIAEELLDRADAEEAARAMLERKKTLTGHDVAEAAANAGGSSMPATR